jgi:hypothetical protein
MEISCGGRESASPAGKVFSSSQELIAKLPVVSFIDWLDDLGGPGARRISGRPLVSTEQATEYASNNPAEKPIGNHARDYPGNVFPQPAKAAMKLLVFARLLERFVGLLAALRAEYAQLLFSHRPKELRRRLLTALWAGYGLAHRIISVPPRFF